MNITMTAAFCSVLQSNQSICLGNCTFTCKIILLLFCCRIDCFFFILPIPVIHGLSGREYKVNINIFISYYGNEKEILDCDCFGTQLSVLKSIIF
jgi:hypothetical protein